MLPLISPFLLLSLLLFLFFMKKYICPKKNSVIYLSCYHVSISPLQAVNCIPWAVKICLFLSNLYHRCLCHTYGNACLGCVFIYWEYINHFMYRSVSGLFTTIITDQRDSLNGFISFHFFFFSNFFFWAKEPRKRWTQQWWYRKEKKSHLFSFLIPNFIFSFNLCRSVSSWKQKKNL